MKKKINRLCLAGIVLLLFCYSLSLQAQKNALDKYIEEGLSNNLVLQQKNIDIKKAWYALQHAESLFLPVITFQASYQTGAGGRTISLPMGDLMNPVYATLNQLTRSEKFSPINNVDEDFLANNFYDAKIRTSIPILNIDLNFNKKIEQQRTELAKFEAESYKLELIRNIKVAYYSYFSAIKNREVYESALGLANENMRVNERLLQNGKGLPSYVLRSKSEQENIQARIIEAGMAAENATLYFNFLLNRNSQDSIDVAFNCSNVFEDGIALLASAPDVSNRPELIALTELVELHGTVIKMKEKYWMPKINGFADLGSQAQKFRFNANSQYYNAGIQLDIPLFSGKRNLIKIQQAQLDRKTAVLNLNYTSQQFALAATSIKNNLFAVYQTYKSATKSLESAASYQRLIERGFREGINTFIEDIDARNLLTAAQLQVNICHYNVLITAANFERETGSLK